MPEVIANLIGFTISTVVGVLFFAVLPGLALLLAGLVAGLVPSLPILAVALLTRLVK